MRQLADPQATAEWLVCMIERVPVQIDREVEPNERERHRTAVTGVIM